MLGVGLKMGGSSPLARGTLLSFCCGSAAPGLIPARAGNTSSSFSPSGAQGAHPRSRGEHADVEFSASGLLGSSPLARGTLFRMGGSSDRPGLIPARAGNTTAKCFIRSAIWAHPRSRGEHLLHVLTGYRHRGSSPLARGTPRLQPLVHRPGGLIPARAGNTKYSNVSPPIPWAHPRSRGEHNLPPRPHVDTTGSSPLARGTQKRFCPTTICRGLIPARAGNTSPINVTPLPCWAHPRSRGEHKPPG